MNRIAVSVLLLSVSLLIISRVQSHPIDTRAFKSLAAKLGTELWEAGTFVTRREEIQNAYKDVQVNKMDGDNLMRMIANDLEKMALAKTSAIKRIMDTAENSAMAHQEDVTDFIYYSAKNLTKPLKPDEVLPQGFREVELTKSNHFFNTEVNTSFSAVHVPTNVFDKAPDLLQAISWSEHLNHMFVYNYDTDPSLSWQYFGSSLGFMRLYPAMKWTPQPAELEVDLYDCRTRPWYIEGAASPKDLIILVDNSGSMTGLRKEIARQVVNDILDTLGNNDYVNVYNFSEEISEVVPCYENQLVQATLENIRELKRGMEDLYTDKIANFSAVLHHAFGLLQSYRDRREAAYCNQAIMLITDGVPYNYKDIFRMYNWLNLPEMPVRMFTYLIGREVADVREIKWMACENRGFYVHLSTLAEVREKVLEYIPVMARPLVLGQNDHPIIWTPVYADVTDSKTTDWLWEKKECKEQKEIFQGSRRDKFKFNSSDEQYRRYMENLKRVSDEQANSKGYQLMTSVAIPVYDRRQNATKIAYLLGVAGTDVPIKEIQDLMLPHLLGVNGYAFIVTNNGHILTHPDHRPTFQGILKPSYNSVDMTEVELVEDDDKPRIFSEKLLKLRNATISRETGNVSLNVKYHLDNLKRVSTSKRSYHYCPIKNTPFSLVVSLPHNAFRVHAEKEIRRLWSNGENIEHYFVGNWALHPEWTYCRYFYDTEHSNLSPEELFLHFLRQTQRKFQWLSKRVVTPPEHVGLPNSSTGNADKMTNNSYFCDRELFQSVVFDAKATDSFLRNLSSIQKDDAGNRHGSSRKRKQFQEKFGITISFVSTRSGLTRWDDIVPGSKELKENHFSKLHNRSIDETWYKRAVEQHYENNKSFVYSVPFDAGDKNGTLVTASHAIFHSNAPAAVVGFQFLHSAFYTLFRNISNSEKIYQEGYLKKEAESLRKFEELLLVPYGYTLLHFQCDPEDIECYILDDNGYVVISENHKDTGKFFGEVRASVMESMIQHRIFKTIHMFDYQAVCFRPKSTNSRASFFVTPLTHLLWLLEWFLINLTWMMGQINLQLLWELPVFANEYEISDGEIEDGNGMMESGQMDGGKGNEKQYEKWTINRTRPQPCDMEVDLYKLQRPIKFDQQGHLHTSMTPQCSLPFDVQEIQASNLILVVVDLLCDMKVDTMITSRPEEVTYDEGLACYKSKHTLFRQRPVSCINNHTGEKDIVLCGNCHGLHCCIILLLFNLLLNYLAS